MNNQELTDQKIKNILDDINKDRMNLYTKTQNYNIDNDNKKLHLININKMSILDNLTRQLIKLQNINNSIETIKKNSD